MQREGEAGKAERKPKRTTAKRAGEDGLDQVNFGQLHMNTLKRYKRHYKLPQDTPTKQELVEVVSNHFHAQEVQEMDTILLFIHMIRNNMNKFDQKSQAGAVGPAVNP
eukprot:m.102440 g.102440  ORF g.102440 m.102440 type:complete len:108 (-) comp15689_c0_seq6:2016-2339(-)